MIFKAETGDNIQYLTSTSNDSTIRFAAKYPGFIDARLLSQSVRILTTEIDLLHSTFRTGFWGGKWILNQDFETEGLCSATVVDEPVLEAATRAVSQPVPYAGKTQLRCFLFRNRTESAIGLAVSHMCADGRDALYLLKKLAEIYTSLAKTGTQGSVKFKNGDRSINQCYDYDSNQLKIQKTGPADSRLSAIQSKYTYLSEKSGTPHILSRNFPAQNLSLCRKLVENSTVNDVLLAAYSRAYISQTKQPKTTPVKISTMIDLRRYIPSGDSKGLANLSSSIDLILPDGIGDSFTDTLSAVTAATSIQKNGLRTGVDFYLLLEKAFKRLPFFLIKLLAGKFYENMSIGLTNIGNVRSEELLMDPLLPSELRFSGALKKKPALQLSCCGLDGNVTICIALQCTGEDQQQLEHLLDSMEAEVNNPVAEQRGM